MNFGVHIEGLKKDLDVSKWFLSTPVSMGSYFNEAHALSAELLHTAGFFLNSLM